MVKIQKALSHQLQLQGACSTLWLDSGYDDSLRKFLNFSMKHQFWKKEKTILLLLKKVSPEYYYIIPEKFYGISPSLLLFFVALVSAVQ